MRLRNPPTEQQVRDETSARIEAAGYSDHTQRNVLMSGDQEAIAKMDEVIGGIRAKGRALRAMDPIPPNFRDPQFWN